MMDDIILIDKPAGMTSFGVVARVRRVLSQAVGKKVKVGHTGTLDPFATGLMILVTGKKCREAQQFSKLDKWYEAEMILGQESSTGDPEGEMRTVTGDHPTLAQLKEVMAQFLGDIEQRPPMFSAIKINGRRAYDLARAGKEVEMPLRTVHIYALELVSYDYPSVRFRVHVSSGTYIRTLAQDMGRALGTGAYCQQLRRTRIAAYDVSEAQQLADFGIVH